MRPKHQDLPPDASDEEKFNNINQSSGEDTGEWISGGASSRANTRGNGMKSNGTATNF